jgi:uncharacterized protein (DUF1330 family)
VAEQLNEAGIKELSGRAEDGPVYMLNLLEFKPDGGAERYAEYGAAVAPLLEKVGGRIVFAGQPGEAVIGEGKWDLMALVEYPTRQAFLDMTSSPEYVKIMHLRTESLVRSELRPIDKADVPV